MLKCVNHPNILQFIGILHREGRVLVLITGTHTHTHTHLLVDIHVYIYHHNYAVFPEYADGGTLRKTIKNFVSLRFEPLIETDYN